MAGWNAAHAYGLRSMPHAPFPTFLTFRNLAQLNFILTIFFIWFFIWDGSAHPAFEKQEPSGVFSGSNAVTEALKPRVSEGGKSKERAQPKEQSEVGASCLSTMTDCSSQKTAGKNKATGGSTMSEMAALVQEVVRCGLTQERSWQAQGDEGNAMNRKTKTGKGKDENKKDTKSHFRWFAAHRTASGPLSLSPFSSVRKRLLS